MNRLLPIALVGATAFVLWRMLGTSTTPAMQPLPENPANSPQFGPATPNWTITQSVDDMYAIINGAYDSDPVYQRVRASGIDSDAQQRMAWVLTTAPTAGGTLADYINIRIVLWSLIQLMNQQGYQHNRPGTYVTDYGTYTLVASTQGLKLQNTNWS